MLYRIIAVFLIAMHFTAEIAFADDTVKKKNILVFGAIRSGTTTLVQNLIEPPREGYYQSDIGAHIDTIKGSFVDFSFIDLPGLARLKFLPLSFLPRADAAIFVLRVLPNEIYGIDYIRHWMKVVCALDRKIPLILFGNISGGNQEYFREKILQDPILTRYIEEHKIRLISGNLYQEEYKHELLGLLNSIFYPIKRCFIAFDCRDEAEYYSLKSRRYSINSNEEGVYLMRDRFDSMYSNESL